MEAWRNELYHYGVPGMKWGVRRYQPYPKGKSGVYVGDKNLNIDYGYSSPYKTVNSMPEKRYRFFGLSRNLTKKSEAEFEAFDSEYMKRYKNLTKKRKAEAKAGADDVESILNSMSADDLDKIEIRNPRKYAQDGRRIVKRFVLKDSNNVPVSFLDLKSSRIDSLNVVIGTRGGDEYRKKKYASEVTKAAMQWVEQNGKYMELPISEIEWQAHTDNKGSRKLAENNGFELDYEGRYETAYRRKV